MKTTTKKLRIYMLCMDRYVYSYDYDAALCKSPQKNPKHPTKYVNSTKTNFFSSDSLKDLICLATLCQCCWFVIVPCNNSHKVVWFLTLMRKRALNKTRINHKHKATKKRTENKEENKRRWNETRETFRLTIHLNSLST